MPSDFLEKTLEDVMFENKDRIQERGFEEFYKNTQRQVILPSGRRIDIFSWEITPDNVLKAKVIELKKEDCTTNALFQGLKYLDEIFLQCIGHFDDLFLDLIIIGSYIPYEMATLLTANPKNLRFYTYNYDWDGIRFQTFSCTAESVILELKKSPEPPYESSSFSMRLRNLQVSMG